MKSLIDVTIGQIYKIVTLRVFWVGLFVLFLLMHYLVRIDLDYFSKVVPTLNSGVVTDLSGEQKDYTKAIIELLIGPHIQSICLFYPLLIALVSGLEARANQSKLELVVVPNRLLLTIGKTFAHIIIITILVFFTYLITSIVFYIQEYPMPAQNIILSNINFILFLRLVLFTVMLTTVADGFTAIFNNPFAGLAVLILMIAITLSGILLTISPLLHNLSPIIALEPFIAGYRRYSDQVTYLTASLDMFAHFCLGVSLLYIGINRRSID